MNSDHGWTLGEKLECADSSVLSKKLASLKEKRKGIHPLSVFTFQYSFLAQKILGFENRQAYAFRSRSAKVVTIYPPPSTWRSLRGE
jgi:hypothetical protein